MNTPVFMVQGNWRRASSSANIDLEAQTITGTLAPFVCPEPARTAPAPTRTPHPSTISTTTDLIDDFFGVTRLRATHESQHDLPPSLDSDILPPPYANTDLPAYSATPNTEPITLAMYLFKFGFLFPPFWVVGALIWMSPLIAPAEFEPSKSSWEREGLVKVIRDAEVRWAKRCVWALGALLVLAGIVAVVALVALDT